MNNHVLIYASKRIRMYIKDHQLWKEHQGITVTVKKDLLIIDNLNLFTNAKDLAENITALKFIHITQSTIKLKQL